MAEKDRPLNTLNDQDMNLFLKDVSVGRRFWESLVCLDPTKKGWIMDEHVELWVNYMWHFRPYDADWAMNKNFHEASNADDVFCGLRLQVCTPSYIICVVPCRRNIIIVFPAFPNEKIFKKDDLHKLSRRRKAIAAQGYVFLLPCWFRYLGISKTMYAHILEYLWEE
ncbi:hypothetical protein Tco_0891447 [Tanacetum coccineum]|uniref:Aminotransferase-like plant mobile domain-containing protein n=1 Tax=Tanacetum coccineum TaxID=301880 RepID=A0ABQ5C2Y0_9ASTR